jgi:Tol biopolymer transport system component
MVAYDPLTGAPMEALMQRSRWLLVLVLAGLGGVRCAETPSNPSETLSSPPAIPANTLPELIVSEALAPAPVEAASSAGSVVALTFVSLPPGILSNVASVRIRNVTTGGSATAPVPIVDGGFDPVAVLASGGDRLELSLTDGSGGVREEYATVPAKRPPVVVRTAPMAGRTDVALLVRPVVVFSEPIDPATLPVGMRLVTGLTPVDGRIELLEPWVAEFVPASPLVPGARYELEITRDVHDLVGAAVEGPVTVTFTTQPTGEPFEPRLAFVRSSQPGLDGTPGPPSVYVARADGSRVTRLASGERPAWSPDGRSIAFVRGGQIRLINSDGSGERLLAYGTESSSDPAWSPDGTKIVFGAFNSSGTSATIFVLNVTTPGAPTPLIRANSGDALFPASPQWSPDGRRISFIGLGDWFSIATQFYLMNADGSDPHPLELSAPPCKGAEDCPYLLGPPSDHHAWSPDGSSIAAPLSIYYPADGSHALALTVFDTSGANPRIHFAEPRQDGFSYLDHPAWSPDGHSVAFEKYMLAGGCTPPACPMRIWVVGIEDGSARQLIPDMEALEGPDYWDRQPAWSRAGD